LLSRTRRGTIWLWLSTAIMPAPGLNESISPLCHLHR
jgi:hypothetical protein